MKKNKFLEIYLSIKKKISAETVFGLLPKLYCEKKKNLYCKDGIVLQ